MCTYLHGTLMSEEMQDASRVLARQDQQGGEGIWSRIHGHEAK